MATAPSGRGVAHIRHYDRSSHDSGALAGDVLLTVCLEIRLVYRSLELGSW